MECITGFLKIGRSKDQASISVKTGTNFSWMGWCLGP